MRFAVLVSETVTRNAHYIVEAPNREHAIQKAQRGETVAEDSLEDVEITHRSVTEIEELDAKGYPKE